jgi:hypothetical protein
MSEADELYEMVNLVPRLTGLPMTVWASPRGAARHDVRIKVNRTHGRQMVMPQPLACAPRRGSLPANYRRPICKPSVIGSG